MHCLDIRLKQTHLLKSSARAKISDEFFYLRLYDHVRLLLLFVFCGCVLIVLSHLARAYYFGEKEDSMQYLEIEGYVLPDFSLDHVVFFSGRVNFRGRTHG